MQNVSQSYSTILAGDHWFETRLEIRQPNADVSNLTDASLIGRYDESKLYSISTYSEMLDKTFEIGSAVSAEIDVTMVRPSEYIPPMAMLIPYVKACNATQESEWLMQGVFFIDTRKESKTLTGDAVLIIHGYDAMMKAEKMHSTAVTRTDVQLVESIARVGMGLKDANNNALVDPRTWAIMTENYSFTVTPSYAMRDTLRNIACAYAGWFVITERGYLRLITVNEFPKETNYLVTEGYSPITFGTGNNATRILI